MFRSVVDKEIKHKKKKNVSKSPICVVKWHLHTRVQNCRGMQTDFR